MSLFNLLTNTVEGALETTLNSAKVVVGSVSGVLDEGKMLDDGMKGVSKGVEKIGKSD